MDQNLTEECDHPGTDDTETGWGRLCPCLPDVFGKAHVTNKTSQNLYNNKSGGTPPHALDT